MTAPSKTARPNHRFRIADVGSWLLAAALLLAPASASGQETQYFTEQSRPWFSWGWDALARYDRVDHRDYYTPIDRGRFEIRPEIDFDPWDSLRIGFRGVFDYGTEAENYPQFDNYRARGGSIERYYVLWKPGRFELRLGRFGMPLLASEVLWDRDIQTPGGAAEWTSPDGAWTIAAAGFYAPQNHGDRSRIGVGQVVWRTGSEDRVALEASASYWSYDLRQMPPAYIRENTAILVGGQLAYGSDFHVADLLLRLRARVCEVPLLLSLDGIHNFEAAAKKKNAFEATLAAGRVGTPGDVRAFYTYQYVQRDALVAAYNTDDWWFHTWYEGHRAGVAVTFLPQTYLQVSGSVQRRLDTRNWINRYLVDVVKMF
ncbi:MAG TPA: hypothetical protein VGH97_00120 [Thermoanaerobaculia bacterium]